MPPLELGRHEVIGLKEDFKARAFAKPGGQEFDLVTIKDFFSRDKNCRKVKQCLMAPSKTATCKTEKNSGILSCNRTFMLWIDCSHRARALVRDVRAATD